MAIQHSNTRVYKTIHLSSKYTLALDCIDCKVVSSVLGARTSLLLDSIITMTLEHLKALNISAAILRRLLSDQFKAKTTNFILDLISYTDNQQLETSSAANQKLM